MNRETTELDDIGALRRTHACSEIRAEHVGREVVLAGWVHRRRDHGGVIFVDLRDRDALVQVLTVSPPDRSWLKSAAVLVPPTDGLS